MRFYSNQHQFYCGIDLHANSMYACVLGHDGQSISIETLTQRNPNQSLTRERTGSDEGNHSRELSAQHLGNQ